MQYHNCNSVFAGAPWHGRSLPFCKTSIHGLLTCSLTWHLNPLDNCYPWCLNRSLCSRQQRGKAWKCTPSLLVQMADLSTNEIQEMTSESNTIQGSEEQQSAKIKKKVAMWVGYVGTHYKGLQMQRGPNSGQVSGMHSLTALFSLLNDDCCHAHFCHYLWYQIYVSSVCPRAQDWVLFY
jgi:hypothetical protein